MFFTKLSRYLSSNSSCFFFCFLLTYNISHRPRAAENFQQPYYNALIEKQKGPGCTKIHRFESAKQEKMSKENGLRKIRSPENTPHQRHGRSGPPVISLCSHLAAAGGNILGETGEKIECTLLWFSSLSTYLAYHGNFRQW